jgi:hypothetical protein
MIALSAETRRICCASENTFVSQRFSPGNFPQVALAATPSGNGATVRPAFQMNAGPFSFATPPIGRKKPRPQSFGGSATWSGADLFAFAQRSIASSA